MGEDTRPSSETRSRTCSCAASAGLSQAGKCKKSRQRLCPKTVFDGYLRIFRPRRQKAEPLRDWRRSSVLLHKLLNDLGQRQKLVPLPNELAGGSGASFQPTPLYHRSRKLISKVHRHSVDGGMTIFTLSTPKTRRLFSIGLLGKELPWLARLLNHPKAITLTFRCYKLP